MKKFLSLVLALAMAMSLVVVNTSAKEFTDDADITYDEAVAVVSEIGIVDGYTDGSFNPTNGLTRGAAAKIICNLILGPTTAAELHADTAPYSDVPITNEFAGYIAYCSQQGIISGYANGTFRPAAPLTGYAFMKMLLGALGYDQYTEGYVGDNWSIQVAKQAIGIGLNASLEEEFNGVDYVNREEAALYTFNTLKADMVEYDTVITTTINGQEVTIGNSQAKAMEWLNSATRKTNIKDDQYVQFAEQYFPKLVLDNATDAFGRPTRDWTFNGEEIGSYVNRDLLVETYTTKVTGQDLYNLLGRSVIEDKDYDFFIYVDGETEQNILDKWVPTYFTQGNLVRSNDKAVGDTGNGVLTEVYRDVDAKEVTIAIINTYVGVAQGDYSTRQEEAVFNIWGIDDAGKNQFVKHDGVHSRNLDASIEDFDVEDVKDGDVVLVTVAEGAIQTITDPETLSNVEISAFKKGSNLTVDGTKYNYASTACYDGEALVIYTSEDDVTINLKDTNYDVILDPYGYVIGVKELDPATNYVFITGADSNYSNLVATTADMNAIFLDGTMKTIEVNVKKSDALNGSGWTGSGSLASDALINTWCTYTVNDEGVYTLKVAKDQYDWDLGSGNTKDINKKSISLYAGPDGGTGRKYVYGNDDTVYLNVSLENIYAYDNKTLLTSVIGDVESVSVGVKNTDLQVKDVTAKTADDKVTAGLYPSAEIYTVWDGGYAVGVVAIGEDQGVSSNYAYVTSTSVSQEAYDKTTKEYTWSREVVIDGQLTEITYKGDTIDVIGVGNGVGRTDNEMDAGYWYKVTYYADGTVKNTVALRDTIDNAAVLNDEYVGNIKDIEDAVHDADKDVVLYSGWYGGTGNSLKYENGSLYVINSDKTGFSVSPEVRVVLANTDGLGNRWDEVDDTYTGYTGLESAIRDLNYNFQGRVSAILEGGVATSIILDCSANDPGYNGGSNVDTSDTYKVSLAVTSGKVVLTVDGLKSTISAQNFTWTATATNTNSGYVQTLTSAAPVAAPTDNVTSKTDDIASALNGLVVYEVTVTFDDGTTLTTNTVMG